jgi:hypothetical protein
MTGATGGYERDPLTVTDPSHPRISDQLEATMSDVHRCELDLRRDPIAGAGSVI